MPETDVLNAIGAAVSSPAHTITETYGPAAEVTVDIAVEGSPLRPVSEIKLVQDGEGTPSLENIRNISGWSSISLTHNGTATDQALPETVYGGSYDWGKGVLTVTYKFFSLAVADMNNSEIYPGWQNVGIVECVEPGVAGGTPGLVCYNAQLCAVNSNVDRIFFFNTISQSEWKAQYPDLICQFVFTLLEPRVIHLTPHEFLALSGTNTLSSDCGNTTVTFTADLKQYIDKKLSELTKEAGNGTV